MHGYAANAVLQARMVDEWAGVSRPQVYYSLEKLKRLGFLRTVKTLEPHAGPERSVLSTTAAGRAALAHALEREDWTTGRERPPFLTWLALSWQARPQTFSKQVERRRTFLKNDLNRLRNTLRAVQQEVGHPFHEAVWMVSLNIDRIRTELRWLQRLSRESSRRAAARNPQYFGEKNK